MAKKKKKKRKSPPSEERFWRIHQRSHKFKTPTNKKSARGRTYREDDE